jgi:hypothetical protein
MAARQQEVLRVILSEAKNLFFVHARWYWRCFATLSMTDLRALAARITKVIVRQDTQ